ncbi:MAG: TIGR02099 family protein, partial [Burkholderiaceae bacterium]|nr:TIGR02099 family protein [Burkholderiaceae bacterium]
MASDRHTSISLLSRVAATWRTLGEGYRRFNAAAWSLPSLLLKLMLAVYFLFCIAFLALRFFVLPNIGQYKGEFEQMASRALGKPVTVARLEASWDGLRPHLELGEVVVRDKDGRAALNLPGVSATVAWRSIPAFGLRLHQLEIRQPDLDIRRDIDGKLYIAGLPIDLSAETDGQGADWVLLQNEIVIRDGRLRWNDDQRKTSELSLQNVNLVLQNGWRHHRFQLQATPPEKLAAPVDVRADFVHPFFAQRISDVRQWKGELYADLDNTDLAAWKTYFDYPFELERGSCSIRAWLTFDHAKLADFTADLRLSDVFARLRKDLVPLDLLEVKGRISAREEPSDEHEPGTPAFGMQGHSISLTDFSLKTRDGLTLPETTVSESYTPGKNGAPGTTKIATKQLDLNVLASFSKYLPLSTEQRQMLADFSPSGQLQDF